MPNEKLLLINLLLYLLGFGMFIISAMSKRVISEAIVSFLSIAVNLSGLVLALLLLSNYKEPQQFLYAWIELPSSSLPFSLLINKLTLLLWILVQIISLIVQLFSSKYMRGDKRFTLYYSYLNLFIFSMLGLVCSGNLLFIFIFWELVGFCSYLLIGFWYQKDSANKAALKAFIVNRIGDAGFLIGIGLVYFQFQTLELSELIDLNLQHSTLIGLLLFMGCLGKSAQFPLQIWLPDAMEGPTPVSALIHAATMVAAGIFLLARIDFLFTPMAGIIIASIGGITALLAAYSAIFQNDIKKVLAYSTISQLGLMVMAMGAGATHAALFHLFTHAFFKAGLFLIAGAVIYHFSHEQNMKKMGDLWKVKPFLSVLFIICAASLIGLPFFSGFLSKDAVLISTWNWALDFQNPAYLIIPILGISASLLTAYYMVRLFVLVFLPRKDSAQIKSSVGIFEWAILPLALSSIWIFYGIQPLDFENSFFSNVFHIKPQANHWLGYLILCGSVAAMVLSYFNSHKEILSTQNTFSFWHKLGQSHFFFNSFYTQFLVQPLFGEMYSSKIQEKDSGVQKKGLAKYIYDFDRLIIDGFTYLLSFFVNKTAILAAFLDENFVDGLISSISKLISKLGKSLKKIQGGKIQSYLIALILILTILLIILNLL